MIHLKQISIFLFVLITLLTVISCEDSEESDDYGLDPNEALNDFNSSLALNGTDYEDDYDEEDEEECTVDAFIDQYSELLLPEDYEEGKQLDFTQRSFTLSESVVKIKRLHQYQQNVSRKMDPIIKRLAPRLSEMLFYVDLPSECMVAIARIGEAARNGENWAFKFVDSLPSGKVLTMQINSLPFGEFDECLSIESPEVKDKEKIYGKYCALGLPSNIIPASNPDHILDYKHMDEINLKRLKEKLNFSADTNIEYHYLKDKISDESDGHFFYGLIQFMEYLGPDNTRLPPGLCIPSACDPKDVEWAINKILYPMTKINTIINPNCDYKLKPTVINTNQIISFASIGVMALLCTFCTIIYVIRNLLREKPVSNDRAISSMERINNCFAIIPNFKAIFDSTPKLERFSALDGIRAVLCFWMCLQHEYESGFLPLHTSKQRQSAPFKFSHQWRYIFLINWNLTDTFFLMGGFLTCFGLLSKLDQSKGRYLRMIPVILTAIAITILIELIGDGPIWPLITTILKKPCIDNPTPTILMVNNYISWPDMIMCVPVTWYSATDYQLYLLAPAIILVLYFSPKIGVIWNILAIILGSFIGLAPKLLFGIPHFFESYRTLNFDEMTKTVSHHYWGIEPHFQLYVLGILLGYVIHRHPNAYLGGRIGEVFIWAITWGLTFFAMFWHRDYFNLAKYTVTELDIITWIAFSKVTYAAGWCWAFYALTTGRGGFINKFFSWHGFKPFAYLMLEIYILHLFVLIYRYGTAREHVHYSDYFVWTVVIFDYILVFILSIIVNVIITKPLANLLQLAFKGPDRRGEEFLDTNNNDLKMNGKENDLNDNNITKETEIVVVKNVAFDTNDVVLDKNIINESFVNNIEMNGIQSTDNKEIALKM